ncbi:MAG: SRPBCC family protein [Actinomycetota bacterium]|nr:SRPBCC family protein [Actinomycetota bacterium]
MLSCGRDRVSASARVAADPEDVFAFLSDPANQRLLVKRFVEMSGGGTATDTPGGKGLVLRGPLGLRRNVRTEVHASSSCRLVAVRVRLGRRDDAWLTWILLPRGGETDVELTVEIEVAGALDRLRLTLAARRWLKRELQATLESLSRLVRSARDDVETGRDDAPAVPMPWPRVA